MTTNPENKSEALGTITPEKIKNTKIPFMFCIVLTFIAFMPIQIGKLSSYATVLWSFSFLVLLVFSFKNWKLARDSTSVMHAFGALLFYVVIFLLFFYMNFRVD